MASLIKSSSDLVKSFWDDVFPMDRFFDRNFPNWKPTLSVPAVNIHQTDTEFQVELAAPGKVKEDFVVKVENGTLNISSEEKEEHLEEEKNYTRREYNYSSFSRSFALPENVQEDKIAATYQDGVLKVTLPKKEVAPPANGRQIKIS